MILIIVTIAFVGTEVALGYALWRGARDTESPGRALFTHGSHSLEVIWTIVPAGVLLFIALYQLDTWAAYRVKENYPMESRLVADRRSDGPPIRMAAALPGAQPEVQKPGRRRQLAEEAGAGRPVRGQRAARPHGAARS